MPSSLVWTPELIEDLLDGRWVNRSDFSAKRVVTSSRRSVQDALFIGYTDATFRRYMGDTNFVRFARKGRRFGNLRAARRAVTRGGVAAMIVEVELNVPVPQLVVDDAFAALETLAKYKRSLVKSHVIAVTGTVGKSSTLKALDAALGERSERLSRFNVRNSLAVGMANAPIGDEGSYLLAEVSVSALWGDDSGASRVLQPDIVLLTEIGLGMTHRVPTVRDTAVVKANLIDGVRKDGVVLFNSEMKYADYVKDRSEHQSVAARSFGFDPGSDYRIIDDGPAEGSGGDFYQAGQVIGPESRATLSIPAIGKAHLYANTAALAVADILGEDLPEAAQRVHNYRPSGTAERITRITDEVMKKDHHIVDGTFSATPLSMRNSFDLAAQIRDHFASDEGELIGVLARVVALGDQAEEAHRTLAEPLVLAGFDRVYTYGPDMDALVDELKARGIHAGHYSDTNQLVENLATSLTTHSTILLKGSKRASDFRDVRVHLNSYFEMDTIAAAVTVAGHVQGVGYRKWARVQANKRALVGWVRNSGSDVTMHVQGPRKVVREFVDLCHQGPKASHVSEVVHGEAKLKRFSRFRVWKTTAPSEAKIGHEGGLPAGSGQAEELVLQDAGSMAPVGFEPAVVASGFGSQKLSAYVIALESWRRGLTVRIHSPDAFRFTVSDGSRNVSFFGSKSSLTTSEAVRAVDNKHVTLKRLHEAQVPVPRSRLLSTLKVSSDELVATAEQDYQWPVVIKPVTGSRGDGVFANITTGDELKESYEYLVNIFGATRILLEEHVYGDDYRIYVVGKSVVGAAKRIPANVVGDGQSSVRQLISAKNALRKQNPFLSKGLIRRDIEIDSMLHRQGLSYDSTPEAGTLVQLRQKANASAGGDVEDVTEAFPDELRTAAVAAVGAINGLETAAVDMLWNPEAGTGTGSFVIIELNVRTHIGVNMYPTLGRGVDIPKAIIDHIFPESPRSIDTGLNSLALNFESILRPMREGSAAHVEIAKLPRHAYPVRRVINFGQRFEVTPGQQTRILLASRKLGVSGALDGHTGSSRLIAAGERTDVASFLSRVGRILGKNLSNAEDWHGTVMMGFYFSDQPLLEA